MKKLALRTAGRASPGMRYRDVGAAIEFLSRAFGCEVRTTETDPDGTVIYAELSFGSTIIMVGAVSGFDIDRYMKQPGDIGGAETQCCYYVVDDVDAQYARARRAGCEIVIDMQTRPNGAKSFTCRDLEGHLWSFGTYDPWQSLSIAPDLADTMPQAMAAAAGDTHAPTHQDGPKLQFGPTPQDAPPHQEGSKLHNVLNNVNNVLKHHGLPKLPARVAAGLSIAAVATSVVAAWVYRDAGQTSREATTTPTVVGPERVISLELGKETFQQAIKDVRRRLAIERRTRRAAERASKAAKAEAAKERSLRITAEEAAKKLTAQLAAAQEAADSAQRAASAAEANLEKERASSRERTAGDESERVRLTQELQLAQRGAAKARAELERAKQAQAEAEQEAKRTRARLTFVSHRARKNSEQAIAEIRKQLVDEKAARKAAEREVAAAREDLDRERDLRAAAWQTVEKLKRQLAAAGVDADTEQSPPKKAAAKKAKSKTYKSKKYKQAVAARKRAQARARAKAKAKAKAKAAAAAAPSVSAKEKGWSLYSGPYFVKEAGVPAPAPQ